MCKTDSQQKLLYNTVISAQCSVMTQRVRWREGWEGSSRRREYRCVCVYGGQQLSLVQLCILTDCKPARLLYPWNFPGKNTGVGCHFLLQVLSLTQGSNLCLLHCRQIIYHLSHKGSSNIEEETLKFYITSCSFCLHNSACSLQSLDNVGHIVSESVDLQNQELELISLTLVTVTFVTAQPLQTCLIMPVHVKVRHLPSHLDCCSRAQKNPQFKPAYKQVVLPTIVCL